LSFGSENVAEDGGRRSDEAPADGVGGPVLHAEEQQQDTEQVGGEGGVGEGDKQHPQSVIQVYILYLI
jgi:hypothetical protein